MWGMALAGSMFAVIPTLAVCACVLFVNFFIPIKTRLDHARATALTSGIVWGAWELLVPTAAKTADRIVIVAGTVVLVLIADFIGTYINFTNRIRNAIVTAIVFGTLYYGAFLGFLFLLVQAYHVSDLRLDPCISLVAHQCGRAHVADCCVTPLSPAPAA